MQRLGIDGVSRPDPTARGLLEANRSTDSFVPRENETSLLHHRLSRRPQHDDYLARLVCRREDPTQTRSVFTRPPELPPQ